MEHNTRAAFIRQMLKDERSIEPSPEFSYKAHLKSRQDYDELYRRSLTDPDAFWGDMAERHLDWYRSWDAVEEYDFDAPRPFVRYFRGGQLNASYNCIDRHLDGPRRNKAALIWQGEPSEEVEVFTYQRLHREVCKAANVLKSLGVQRGDRVVLYLPMIPQLAIAMLACARIGAVHCVVFSGLSAEALKDRIDDSGARVVVTANFGYRSGKILRIKGVCDQALAECPQVKTCLVVRRIEKRTTMEPERDVWWDDLTATASPACEPERMEANEPLFVLYTSGSTAKPKGIVHGTGGYLLYATLTMKYVFDLKETDIHWCTADAGWITGHSYIVYGPLASGATSLMFEGVPNYPKPDRFWEVVEKFGVNLLYTAPTVVRSLMREGERWTCTHDLSSLRLLGSVGEPITAKAWLWYYSAIGQGRCPVADTWWQTETGGVMITTLPGAVDMKPGSAALPFFGVEPKVVRSDGTPAALGEPGSLVVTRPWPGMMQGVHGNEQAFKDVYFPTPGRYVTGDGAYCDEDGYFWITGRIDDVINVSGHRLGTAEIESALVSCAEVAEAAVVGCPHPVKGEGIYAYVTLHEGVVVSDELRIQLASHVREVIGPIARPDVVHFAKALPKTRSGKIMRRILRKIAAHQTEDLCDISTLSEPSVVADLIRENERLSA
ncbi:MULTISPECIES: acetate--CoA ligase [Gordonibacter]|uniref:Acetate--CoA ligase n=1 Tax=Gordonibacter faecis TaxID=3047475 RepID=A0ABT7DNR7_9ACTN|nr:MULTISPECIES: acetate--CoA ligase [unclassified Gordonibacter]MDJ1651188.1 acetate--CoA ligase [Gordonibacter sp. KGMB12511]HIW77346.1 acetate--CoA ligase [Candidatus Gordonibacter avicola]